MDLENELKSFESLVAKENEVSQIRERRLEREAKRAEEAAEAMSKEAYISLPGVSAYTFRKRQAYTAAELADKLDKVLPIFDNAALKIGLVPLTAQIIRQYETKKRFIEALGMYMETKVKDNEKKKKNKSKKSSESFGDVVAKGVAIAIFGVTIAALTAGAIISSISERKYNFDFYKGRIVYLSRLIDSNRIGAVEIYYVDKAELNALKATGGKIKIYQTSCLEYEEPEPQVVHVIHHSIA